MKSPYCQWLNDLADIAEPKGITINARYHDGLEFFYFKKMPLDEALKRYQDLVRRCEAINEAFKNGEPI